MHENAPTKAKAKARVVYFRRAERKDGKDTVGVKGSHTILTIITIIHKSFYVQDIGKAT